jgi:hypothetical protein
MICTVLYRSYIITCHPKINTRRSKRSDVPGRAKVMSFSELEKARSKGVAKDRAVTDKKKLGCKRKNAAMECPLFKKAKEFNEKSQES